mmetsp:Transcript_27331/g.83065  ORF Transcript_27331/g.83065 Transcript_27331/m.83065 type:complete len:119 (+) Transcript_27331:485-841(+)|eukprot:scaffold188692_cov33-Tisochrysis_lutea.AAC.2
MAGTPSFQNPMVPPPTGSPRLSHAQNASSQSSTGLSPVKEWAAGSTAKDVAATQSRMTPTQTTSDYTLTLDGLRLAATVTTIEAGRSKAQAPSPAVTSTVAAHKLRGYFPRAAFALSR